MKRIKLGNKAEAFTFLVLTSDIDQTSSTKECQKINKNPKKKSFKMAFNWFVSWISTFFSYANPEDKKQGRKQKRKNSREKH